tara:strand:+ start:267 stop:596 length:330 start_codon:yes stop_codon:yes gene_type:complete
MSLSKKNLDKLNNLIKNSNSLNEANKFDIKSNDNNYIDSQSHTNSEDPNRIFYSLIDNSETLNETSEINYSLRKSEEESNNINFRKMNSSTQLSIEDELYDEFNYLLDE